MENLTNFRKWAIGLGYYQTVNALDRWFDLQENLSLDSGSTDKMKEQGIQAKILDKLREQGHYAINIVVASKGGVSDIISCDANGRFWSIEVKKPGEKPRKLQLWNLEQVKKRGGIAFWCDSYDDFLVKYNNSTVV